jgi:hypothetical protein
MEMRRRKGSISGVVLAALAAAVLFSACEQKTIRQIMAEPDRYRNQDVGVVGNVVRSISVLGKGAYEIDDGTGRLWVVSAKGVPRTGAHVGVKGRIHDGFDLSALVKLPGTFRSGIVMMESEHRAR